MKLIALVKVLLEKSQKLSKSIYENQIKSFNYWAKKIFKNIFWKWICYEEAALKISLNYDAFELQLKISSFFITNVP